MSSLLFCVHFFVLHCFSRSNKVIINTQCINFLIKTDINLYKCTCQDILDWQDVAEYQAPVGLPQDVIDKIPYRQFNVLYPHQEKPTPTNDTECAICLEDYRTRQVLRILPCGHDFHHGCIDEWLRVCTMYFHSIFIISTCLLFNDFLWVINIVCT